MAPPEKTCVLLVEGNEDLRALMAIVLEEEGYVVAEAPDGRSALQLVESGRILPSVMLCAQRLADVAGTELIATARQHPSLERAKIAVFFSEPITQVAGADLLTMMPFDPKELVGLVARLLDGSIADDARAVAASFVEEAKLTP